MFFNSKAIDENEVPEFFNNFFASIFNDKVYDVDNTIFGDNIKLEHVLSSFSVELIIKDIVKIKESSALTRDGFPTKLLKSSLYLFGSLLYPLFCSVILCRTFPAIWKVARITPLFKGGSRNNIKFYRPISLLQKYPCYLKELYSIIFIHACVRSFTHSNLASSRTKEQSCNFWITSKCF